MFRACHCPLQVANPFPEGHRKQSSTYHLHQMWDPIATATSAAREPTCYPLYMSCTDPLVGAGASEWSFPEIKQELQTIHCWRTNIPSLSNQGAEEKRKVFGLRCQYVKDQVAFEWEPDIFLTSCGQDYFQLFTSTWVPRTTPLCHRPTATAVSLSEGERRLEKTDPKTIEDPKVMIHRLFTPLCRLGD